MPPITPRLPQPGRFSTDSSLPNNVAVLDDLPDFHFCSQAEGINGPPASVDIQLMMRFKKIIIIYNLEMLLPFCEITSGPFFPLQVPE